MLAVKENREYKITEAEVASFVNDGFDIYDETGHVVRYGAGKTVPFEKYAQLTEQYEKLMEENAVLAEENAKLKARKASGRKKAEKAEKEE